MTRELITAPLYSQSSEDEGRELPQLSIEGLPVSCDMASCFAESNQKLGLCGAQSLDALSEIVCMRDLIEVHVSLSKTHPPGSGYFPG